MIIKKYAKCFKINGELFFEPLFIQDQINIFDKNLSCTSNYKEIFDLRKDLKNIDFDDFYNIYITLFDKDFNFIKKDKINSFYINNFERNYNNQKNFFNFESNIITNHNLENINNNFNKIKFKNNLASDKDGVFKNGNGFISFRCKIDNDLNPLYAIINITDIEINHKYLFLLQDDIKLLNLKIKKFENNFNNIYA